MTGSPEWTCRRCHSSGAARLSFLPWPGALGRTLQDTICDACWNEWLGLQTRIINEYRLNVLDPGHAKALREQMEMYFGLREPGDGQNS